MTKIKEIKVIIPEFITHIPKSKNKYIKINGQRIYSGLNHHLRSLLVRRIHNYLKPYIVSQLKDKEVLKDLFPLKISLDFIAPINYGSVQMRKNKNNKYTLRWKPPEKDYIPGWDADNQWIWGKCFNDVLKELGYIKDDTVEYIKSSGEVNFIECENFKDRKLIFKLTKRNINGK